MKFGKKLFSDDEINYFVTSDTHLYHKHIIQFTDREYVDEPAMRQAMINEWNLEVRECDVVFVLGDFCFGTTTEIAELVDQLNGTIILVLGNHDRPKKIKLAHVHYYFEVHMNGVLVCMSHYPMYCWKSQANGSVMLHGHTHGKFQGVGRMLDVGVDNIGYLQRLDDVVSQAMGQAVVCPDDRELKLRDPKGEEHPITTIMTSIKEFLCSLRI